MNDRLGLFTFKTMERIYAASMIVRFLTLLALIAIAFRMWL